MAAGFNQTTDLYGIYNVVQNTMLRYPKDLIISGLREYFADDSYYHYVRDEWGFPKTPDHTDLEPGAGLYDDATTRLFIGEAYRYDGIYYPALLVRAGSMRYVPISMSRNKGRIDYTNTRFVDGYGNETLFSTPAVFVFDGAWEGQINIDILTRGIRARDDLVELVGIYFAALRPDDFAKAGVAIKPNVSVGSATEGEDRNDKLYKQTVTLDIRTEWKIEVPIANVLDLINICVDFGKVDTTPAQYAPNLTINTSIELIDAIQGL
jgi:hypothetical protein